MARFLRFRKDGYVNLDKVVLCTLHRKNEDKYNEGEQHRETYYLRFLLDCPNLKWIETETMDTESAEYMLEEVKK